MLGLASFLTLLRSWWNWKQKKWSLAALITPASHPMPGLPFPLSLLPLCFSPAPSASDVTRGCFFYFSLPAEAGKPHRDAELLTACMNEWVTKSFSCLSSPNLDTRFLLFGWGVSLVGLAWWRQPLAVALMGVSLHFSLGFSLFQSWRECKLGKASRNQWSMHTQGFLAFLVLRLSDPPLQAPPWSG